MSLHLDKNKSKNDSIRIIKRNLVYVIGLDPKIANKEILMTKNYLGQYGKITRLLVNINKAYNPTNSNQGPSYSAYINYSTEQEAALAILSIDSSTYNGKQIKAAFGTTKYCAFYLKKVNCPNKDCVYIHSVQDKSNIISKESADFYIEQHKIAIKVSDISNPKIRDLLYKNRHEESVFPNPYSVYFKKNIVNQLKLDIPVTENISSNSYNRNNYHNTNNRNAIENTKPGYNNFTSKSNIYNNSNNKKKAYFENSNNNEDFAVTKTIIKEIHYDDDIEKDIYNNNESKSDSNEKDNANLIETKITKRPSLKTIFDSNNNAVNKVINDNSNNNISTNNKEEAQENLFNQVNKKKISVSENKEVKDRKYSYISSNSNNEKKSIRKEILNNSNSNINDNNSSNDKEIIESKLTKSLSCSNSNNINNTLANINYNNFISDFNNSKYTDKENPALNNHYTLFKLTNKSKFNFASYSPIESDNKEDTNVISEIKEESPEEIEVSQSNKDSKDKSSSDFELINNMSLDKTDLLQQSKFLQQYYMRYTFSNLVSIPFKTSIEEDYFTKLKYGSTS